ncbi:MAG: hypothetical protein R3F11_04480 [Verrucomicrobiales bacterium]
MNSHDDLARFIAGMPGPANSAMRAWRDESAWAGHRHRMDRLFERAEHGRLAEVAAWRRRAIGDLDGPVVFYPFGGPDFLYANAFFPGAQTYILCGLEGADPLPDLASLDAYRRNLCLDGTYNSIDTILSFSYFITKEMRVDLKATDLQGALPLILVFAARSGYHIDGIYPVQLGAGGEVAALSGWGGQNGILVAAIGPDGSRKQIYYFRYDLSDEGARTVALRLCPSAGRARHFHEERVYLMHHDYFSRIRDFIRSGEPGAGPRPIGRAVSPARRRSRLADHAFRQLRRGDRSVRGICAGRFDRSLPHEQRRSPQLRRRLRKRLPHRLPDRWLTPVGGFRVCRFILRVQPCQDPLKTRRDSPEISPPCGASSTFETEPKFHRMPALLSSRIRAGGSFQKSPAAPHDRSR